MGKKRKMKQNVIPIILTLILASTLLLNIVPTMANPFVPIIDTEIIPLGDPAVTPPGGSGNLPTAWDTSNPNLVIERGNGYVEVGLPAHGTTLGKMYGTITFFYATITSVQDYDNNAALTVPNGNPEWYFGCDYCNDGKQNWFSVYPNYDGTVNSNDEIDWTTSTVDFWLATTGGRDFFRVNLDYSSTVAAYMVIDYIEGDGYDDTIIGYGQGSPTDYFEYGTQIPLTESTVIEVDIDIKPGSDPNSINLGSKGTIPVAILSTEDFDATTVDPETVELAGATVGTKGKSDRLMASIEDVNGDGRLDLVVHIETEELASIPGDTEAILTGLTYGGTPIEGSDSIRIVQPDT
jgi:hypothetical protein